MMAREGANCQRVLDRERDFLETAFLNSRYGIGISAGWCAGVRGDCAVGPGSR